MYQYFFSKEDQYPFTLCTMKPRQELPLSKDHDLLTDYPVNNALIIMEKSDKDEDNFLNMLDEVYIERPPSQDFARVYMYVCMYKIFISYYIASYIYNF